MILCQKNTWILCLLHFHSSAIFSFKKNICLAARGLSCGSQDLWSSLWHVGSSSVTRGLTEPELAASIAWNLSHCTTREAPAIFSVVGTTHGSCQSVTASRPVCLSVASFHCNHRWATSNFNPGLCILPHLTFPGKIWSLEKTHALPKRREIARARAAAVWQTQEWLGPLPGRAREAQVDFGGECGTTNCIPTFEYSPQHSLFQGWKQRWQQWLTCKCELFDI